MADRIAVMKDGVLQSFDKPQELHDRPRNRFIAEFIGNPPMNLIDVELVEEAGQMMARASHFTMAVPAGRVPDRSAKEVLMGIRPQHVSLTRQAEGKAAVELIEPLGRDNLIVCRHDDEAINVLASPDLELAIGDRVDIAMQMEAVQFFDRASGKSLLWS